MLNNTISFSWRDPFQAERFRTGVSLHSHTLCSQENLSFLPKVLKSVPPAMALIRHAERRYRVVYGRDLDFSRAWWTPPLSPQHAFHLEAEQIRRRLGLQPLVSLSDHDNIEAPAQLHLLGDGHDAPYSIEWTVSYGHATFHIGVHNLPSDRAHSLTADMNQFTAQPKPERLREMLEALDATDEVLVVLNHPLSDEGRIGARIHEDHLLAFLRDYGRWFHALELNALQPWKDNARVARIARDLGFLLISGGDRHACDPNGNVNLTNATTFTEFVHEVRRERISHVLFLPQCREPLALRYIEAMWQIVREDPAAAGREHWTGRIYYLCDDGEARPLSAICTGPSVRVVSRVLAVLGLLASPQIRPALRLMLPQTEEAPL